MRAFYIVLGFLVLAVVAIPLGCVVLVRALLREEPKEEYDNGEAYPDDGHLPPAA